MNASHLQPTSSRPSRAVAAAAVAPAPIRHVHRERDFGIGYGNSSGYASQRSYVQPWAPARFRCA